MGKSDAPRFKKALQTEMKIWNEIFRSHELSPSREPSPFLTPEPTTTSAVEDFLDAYPEPITPGFDTIFLGGGTPSLTPPEDIEEAWGEFPKLTNDPHSPQEWTMEANPSSVDYRNLLKLRKFGVNRISMGVQSVRDETLALLGRVHDSKMAFSALDTVFSAGFKNVSVDLICGVPHQTLADLENALQALTRFPITHISVYLLTLSKTHKMAKDLPSEEKQLEHLLFVHQWLTQFGMEHYEISNFCLPGYQAKHNLNYWKNASYLGVGPSAHSYLLSERHRWKNVSGLSAYAEALANNPSRKPSLPNQMQRLNSPLPKGLVDFEEFLTSEQEEIESWMLNLRLSEGIPKEWIDTPIRQRKTEKLGALGLIEEHPHLQNRLRLTPRGFALSEQVIREFL